VTAATAARVREAVPWLTRRQLEYWVEKGFVVPAGPPSRGHPRVFSGAELRVLAVMGRLAAAGLPAELAARAARAAAELAAEAGADRAAVRLGDGIFLEISDV
jgi:DNA-binding transcriptional MerR regulator